MFPFSIAAQRGASCVVTVFFPVCQKKKEDRSSRRSWVGWLGGEWEGLCFLFVRPSYSHKQSHSCWALWEWAAAPRGSGCSPGPGGGASSPWRGAFPCRTWCSRWSSPSPAGRSGRPSTCSTARGRHEGAAVLSLCPSVCQSITENNNGKQTSRLLTSCLSGAMKFKCSSDS